MTAPGVSPAGSMLNVRQFGARCDGSTDDYAAISAALARAATSGTTGGAVVFFPPSRTACLVSHGLRVPDNVTLRAAPDTATLKPTPDNTSNPVLLAVRNNVEINGLSFDGGGQENSNGANLIQGYQVSRVVFDHIAVRHTRGVGILLSSNIVNSAVRNSLFEDVGNHWRTSSLPKDRKQGVVFCCGTGNQGNSATNNRFSDIGLDALQVSDQTLVTVNGNKFNLENGERSSLRAPDYPAAIFPLHVDQGTIVNNTIIGAQGNCIDASGLTGVTIANNVMRGCGAAGIGLFDARSYGKPGEITDRVEVAGNTIADYGLWSSTMHPGGIVLGGTVTNVSLTRNVIAGTQARTRTFAIFGLPRATLTGLAIDPTNRFNVPRGVALGGSVAGR